jgi:hypothetical protein
MVLKVAILILQLIHLKAAVVEVLKTKALLVMVGRVEASQIMSMLELELE